jgi:coenzyme F420-reducing hydrogenase beta subunit
MGYDEEGFYYPLVDHRACTECGLCVEHCPVIEHDSGATLNTPAPLAYAAKSRDLDRVRESSSGGIFPELARAFLHEGGAVYGAGWGPDFQLEHMCVQDADSLPTLMGSKYIQSHIGLSFQRILDTARQGRKILFCGTPCQVAALHTFLDPEGTSRDNVTTCDLVCHGVGSTLFFRAYLAYLKNREGGEATSISFRAKERGWIDYSMRVEFGEKTYSRSHSFDPFMIAYTENCCLRPACYDCPFSRLPRRGDLTLGDLWGGRKDCYHHLGVSCVLLNNQRGTEVFASLRRSGAIKCREVSLDETIRGNARIVNPRMEIPDKRKQILGGADKEDSIRNLERSAGEHFPFYADYFVLKLKLLFKRFRYRF